MITTRGKERKGAVVLSSETERRCNDCGFYKSLRAEVACLACTPAEHDVWVASGKCPLQGGTNETRT